MRFGNEALRLRTASLLLNIMALLPALISPNSGSCQAISHPLADAVSAEIVSAKPNPDDPSDLIVAVRVTMLATDRPVVIPDCAEDAAKEKVFCLAQLQRPKGKKWHYAKPAVWATLGVENPDTWKPLNIAARKEASYLFFFSTEFFGLRTGERLRLAISVWPDEASVKDWKSAVIVMSPVFECPPIGR